MKEDTNKNKKKLLINRYKDLIPLFKEEKTQNFTTLVLTLVAFSVFGLFAINPTIATIVNLKKQISDSKFILDKLEEKLINLQILQQKYSLLLNTDIPIIYNAIPQNPTVPLLAGQLQELIIENNLTINRLQFLQVELAVAKNATTLAIISTDNGSFAFNLDVVGSPSNITNFISQLVNFDRIVTIDTLSITKDSKTGENTLSLRGKAYFK